MRRSSAERSERLRAWSAEVDRVLASTPWRSDLRSPAAQQSLEALRQKRDSALNKLERSRRVPDALHEAELERACRELQEAWTAFAYRFGRAHLPASPSS